MKTFVIWFFVITIAVVTLGFMLGNPTGTLTSVNASTDPVDSAPRKSLKAFRSEAELTLYLAELKKKAVSRNGATASNSAAAPSTSADMAKSSAEPAGIVKD